MGKPFGAKKESDKSGGGSYPISTEEEAKASLTRAKKELTPEEYAKLLARVCKKFPQMAVCKSARNDSMNKIIRKGFGRDGGEG
jgi:hypothetical protein